MYRRLHRPLLQTLQRRQHGLVVTHGSRRQQHQVPPFLFRSTSWRYASSTTSKVDDDSVDEETFMKRKEYLDKKENEELMDVVENSETADEAMDRILVDEGIKDFDEREKEILKEKWPEALSDEDLEKMFQDDMEKADYLGVDQHGNVSGKADESDFDMEEEKEEVRSREAAKATEAAEETKRPSSYMDNNDDDNIDTPPVEIPTGEKLAFQAETRQLLDIVTHSLYTDKEVFLRELVSNASDALEKLRHMQTSNQVSATTDTELPLEIRIDTDEVTSTITITDTGVGMTKDELISNLGTIARSGSKNYIQQLKNANSVEDGSGIIGKFGVGFYSAFMVGRKVEVRTRSATKPDKAYVWTSDGSGEFEIAELPEGIRQDRGSSLVIHLSDEHWEYASEARIEKILKRYSNFVNYPITLNGTRVNTLKAIWANDPKTVSKEDYTAFYKFIASAVDDPFDTYHFRADAPIDVKALFFVPAFHSEKHGMERMQPGVSLYSRKVLIESKSPNILPDWMRFIKGVVDSEDLPLSISREKPQDSALIAKLRSTLVRKFLAHLAKMSRKEPDRYINQFYPEYQFFLKEGCCQDQEFSSQIAKLLRYETSRMLQDGAEALDNKLVSIDEYISRMRPEQKDIYYLLAPTREAAINSPYLEAFEKNGVEVLLMYASIDDFVMNNMDQYENRKLVSVENGSIDLKDLKKGDDSEKHVPTLNATESLELCEWFKNELGGEKLVACSVSERLTSSPAIVVDNQSASMRRMMRMVNTTGEDEPIGPQSMQINPKHPIIMGLFEIRGKEPVLAKTIAEQLFDNCLLTAGLMDDGRNMIPRLNGILESLVKLTPSAEEEAELMGMNEQDDSTTVVDFDGKPHEAEKSEFETADVIEADFVSKDEASSSSSSDSDAEEASTKKTTEKQTSKDDSDEAPPKPRASNKPRKN